MLNSNNINFDAVKEKLFNKGYISKSNQGRFVQQTHIFGARVNCIRLNIIDENREKRNFQEEFEEITEVKCPFWE